MKPVIIGAASFVLALGLSTGVAVMRHKAAAPAATAKSPADSAHKPARSDSAAKSGAGASRTVAAKDSTVRDSTARDSTARASTVAGSAPTDSTRHDSTTVAVAPLIPSATAPVIPTPVTTLAAHKPVEEPDYKQIAKIFANMKAADAAKVLSYMTDDEVQGVLEKLNVRQAAELMTKLPKDRVAALSRRLAAAPAKP